MPRAGADVTNAAVEDRDLSPIENFAGVNINQLASSDYQIRFDLPHGAANEPFQLYLGARHDKLTNTEGFGLPKQGWFPIFDFMVDRRVLSRSGRNA
jgi:hypothetical protein